MRRQWLRYQIAVATCRNVGSTLVPSSRTPQGTSHQHLKGGEGVKGKKYIQKMECLLRVKIEQMKYMAIMNYIIMVVSINMYCSQECTQLHLSTIYMCCYSLLVGKRDHSLPEICFFRMTPRIALDDFTSTPSHGKVTENPPKAMPGFRRWFQPVEKY